MRILYGFLLFAIAVPSVILGGFFFPLVLGTASYLAGCEFIAMTRAKGINPSARIIKGMVIAFYVVASLPVVPGMHLSWNFSLEHFPILITTGICISFFRLLFRHESRPTSIADVATTILGFIYVGYLPSHLVLLRNLYPPGMERTLNPLQQPGLAYVWVSCFIVWGTDVWAYYCGKRWGKTLLFPEISPKKTVEGAVGGFVAAICLATLVVFAADHWLFPCHPFSFKLWQAPLMGAIVSIAAQLGDLCESMLKRDAGIKDSSTLIPGHGGFLDRGDSLIFGSAISYYWICFVVLNLL